MGFTPQTLRRPTKKRTKNDDWSMERTPFGRPVFAALRAVKIPGEQHVVSKERHLPSRPLRTLPGLRTNDAMAGFLARRSTLLAAFPEHLP
jgi:hypothetical protein